MPIVSPTIDRYITYIIYVWAAVSIYIDCLSICLCLWADVVVRNVGMEWIYLQLENVSGHMNAVNVSTFLYFWSFIHRLNN